jgi:hypothetical protein
MTTPEDAKARAAATYNAAADFFDDPANSFWDRFGRATIERLRPRPGERFLDVCCGGGASALAAAEATTAFWRSIREERPDLYKGFNPWDRICDPESLHKVLRQGGVGDAMIVDEEGRHPIESPEAWWSAVLGTGYRGTLDQLDSAARERVRAANLDYVRSSGIRSVEANVVYAVAVKDAR